jgi:hypothetical protein
MKKSLLLLMVLLLTAGASVVFAQGKSPLKVEVFYFHPNERCPIDQAIELNTGKVMKSDFSKEIAAGSLKFRVINTDEKANEALASKFDINTQALYVVKHENGKEIKKDLTTFAFDYGKSDPVQFMAGLRDEVLKALK